MQLLEDSAYLSPYLSPKEDTLPQRRYSMASAVGLLVLGLGLAGLGAISGPSKADSSPVITASQGTTSRALSDNKALRQVGPDIEGVQLTDYSLGGITAAAGLVSLAGLALQARKSNPGGRHRRS